MNLRRLARRIIRRLPGGSRLLRYRETRSRLKQFRQEFEAFQRLQALGTNRFPLEWTDRYPCLDDHTPVTGYDRHYVYHTA